MALNKFRTSHRRTGNVVIVSATGRLDSGSAPAFEGACRRAASSEDQAAALVVDIRRITALTSAGLRKLLTLARWSGNRGMKFALCSDDNTTGRVLSVSGFDRIIKVFPTPAVALAEIRD